MIWPFLIVTAAGLQVIRNAAQRELTATLGVWGATYVRFLYGLPFALLWLCAIMLWKGAQGGPSAAFLGWMLLGASSQALATTLLILAMKGRAFAVATALVKIEAASAALLGVWLIEDKLNALDWAGLALAMGGVALMSRVSVNRAAFHAALAGVASGIVFGFSAIGFRAAAQVWGGDLWVGAAVTLTATLIAQTLGGAVLLWALNAKAFAGVLRAWRPSLIPGATGASASALIFTSFALGPSAAVVKTVQLVDVLMAWALSRRYFREAILPSELAGAVLIVAGAIAVLL